MPPSHHRCAARPGFELPAERSFIVVPAMRQCRATERPASPTRHKLSRKAPTLCCEGHRSGLDTCCSSNDLGRVGRNRDARKGMTLLASCVIRMTFGQPCTWCEILGRPCARHSKCCGPISNGFPRPPAPLTARAPRREIFSTTGQIAHSTAVTRSQFNCSNSPRRAHAPQADKSPMAAGHAHEPRQSRSEAVAGHQALSSLVRAAVASGLPAVHVCERRCHAAERVQQRPLDLWAEGLPTALNHQVLHPGRGSRPHQYNPAKELPISSALAQLKSLATQRDHRLLATKHLHTPAARALAGLATGGARAGYRSSANENNSETWPPRHSPRRDRPGGTLPASSNSRGGIEQNHGLQVRA